ncbi:MAG: thiamine-binding protein [Sphingobacteriales bacterium]|nr:MAG: thiamine-binding protein [Sphingobacteriales bacterium]
MKNKINLAIQVLPLGIPKDQAYAIVDEAIRCIDSAGLTYLVCPFETVVEGPYDQVMELLAAIQDACRDAGAEEVLINMKLQRNFSKDVYIDDKVEKYRSA